MADTFKNLAGQQIKRGATIEYEMHDLARFMPNNKAPILIGKHAGDSNSNYVAALVKGSSDKAARKAARGKVTPQMIEDQNEKLRERFAKHIFTGWKNVFNGEGKESEFNYENCLAFLQALSADNFGELQDFFSDPSNFTVESLDDDELEEVGNGSAK